MTPTKLLFVMLGLSFFPVRTVSSALILRQLHVISRKGSPTLVVDGPNEPRETLASVGQTQLYDLGAWLRNEFHEDPFYDDDDVSFQLPEGLVDEYKPTRVRFESSAMDSTMVSAQALARGLFPGAVHEIPIFTQARRNDISISAADQCPSFNNELYQLYSKENEQWDQMEQAYLSLLHQLAMIPIFSAYAVGGDNPDEQYIPLQNIWAVYDMIREARVTCLAGYDTSNLTTCEQLTFPNAAALLDDQEWQDVKTLARFTEVEMKYGTKQAGQLIAGNILRQILDRILDDQVTEPNDPGSKRVFVTSADYPTLLAVMAVLKVEPDEEQLDEAFPGYGSAIIIELYQDDETYERQVRVLYKAAEKSRSSVLRVGGECFEKEVCDAKSFTGLVENNILRTDEWCDACGNDTSDLCLFFRLLFYQNELRNEKKNEEIIFQNITTSENPAETIKIIAGTNACPDEESIRNGFIILFVGSTALGVLLTLIVGGIIYRIQKRWAATAFERSPQEKTRPKTPKTTRACSPMAFFQSSTPPPEPMIMEDDLESLGVDGGDEDDEELEGDDDDDDTQSEFKPLSPKRKPPANRSKIPSKLSFPPEIV